MFGNIGGKIKMFLLLFSIPVHPTHPKIEKREQLCMLRQSLTRTSLRASSPHAPFGGYRSWIVTCEGLAKGDERAEGIFSRLASLVIQIGVLWSPVPSPYQSFSLPLTLPQPKVNTNFSISAKCWVSEPACPRLSDMKDSARKKLHFILQFPNELLEQVML